MQGFGLKDLRLRLALMSVYEARTQEEVPGLPGLRGLGFRV